MAIDPEEWMRQADYDMDSAEYLQAGGRNLYAVFLCHLAIEKALKGIIHKKKGENPPKVHSLSYLREIADIDVPECLVSFMSEVSTLSVLTRYPETIMKMEDSFSTDRTNEILDKGKKVVQWLKNELKKL